MSFSEWLLSSYPNPHVNGEWGLLHIITLILCVLFIVISSLLLKNKSQKAKRITIWVLVGILIFFELSRRIINLYKTEDYSFINILKILLPRPGCAISCWLVIIATIVNKKFLYNFASIISILCGFIFFCYPGAGFNNEYILYENLYSIVTHSVFFSTAICFITYGFTDFKYSSIYKELICLAIIAIYVYIEITFKIEGDPFYFMPGNEVQEIVGFTYELFLPLYALFNIIYFNAYYLISERKLIFKKKS